MASTMGAATSANAASIKAPATCDLFLQKVLMKVLDLNVLMISRTLDYQKEVILKKCYIISSEISLYSNRSDDYFFNM